jgi:thioredoxin-related protein
MLRVISLLLLFCAVGCVQPVAPVAPVPAPTPAPSPVAPVAKRTVVYVSGPNCVYCERMERLTFLDNNVKERLKDFAFVRLESQEANRRFKRINGVPAYLLLDTDGKEIKRGSGYRGPDEFLKWIGN